MPKSKSNSKFSRIISGREKQPDSHTGSSSSKKRRLGKDPEPSLSLPSLSGLTVDDLNLESPINLISDEKNKKLDILNKQNNKIINKIDKLSSLIESLEDRLANIEEKIEDIKDNMYEMRTKSDEKTDGAFVNVIKSFFNILCKLYIANFQILIRNILKTSQKDYLMIRFIRQKMNILS
jgi:chromosome segregation ATPase